MKTQLFTALLLSITFFACSDSGTEQTTSDPIPLDHKIEFQFDGGGFDHHLFRSDSLATTGTAFNLTTEAARVTYEMLFADSLSQGSFDNVASLTFTCSKSVDGTTPWKNLWTDPTGFGCTIKLHPSNPHELVTYKSISGQTNLKVFMGAHQADSLFGTFSGKLQDSMGNVITVTNGKFYM